MSLRFQIAWGQYAVVSLPCKHEKNWCCRVEDGRSVKVFPAESSCFSTEESAWNHLERHAVERKKIAEENLCSRSQNLINVRRARSRQPKEPA